MKKLFLALLLAPMLALAQPSKPELNPEQKLAVANAVTALAVGWFVLPAAILTGKQEALCKALGGTYTPAGPDLCPTGNWVAIIPYLGQVTP